MKTYQKPTIFLATAAPAANIGSCIEKADLDLISGIIGLNDPTAIKDAFSQHESCTLPIPIDIYCKFTSSELGLMQAFVS